MIILQQLYDKIVTKNKLQVSCENYRNYQQKTLVTVTVSPVYVVVGFEKAEKSGGKESISFGYETYFKQGL